MSHVLDTTASPTPEWLLKFGLSLGVEIERLRVAAGERTLPQRSLIPPLPFDPNSMRRRKPFSLAWPFLLIALLGMSRAVVHVDR